MFDVGRSSPFGTVLARALPLIHSQNGRYETWVFGLSPLLITIKIVFPPIMANV